jgi:hypothetical protein
MADDYGDIIRRMLHDLEEDDVGPNGMPRCEGCGLRVELASFQLRASNGSVEMVMYCAECRALATIVDAEGHAS